MARRRKQDSGGNIMSSVLAMLLLFGVVQYLAPVLIPIAICLIVCVLLVFVFHMFGKQETTDDTVNSSSSPSKTSREVSYEDIQKKQFQRLLEILHDCQELVNDSDNLETVARRYNMLVSTLYKLNGHEEQMKTLGFSFREPISSTLEYIALNKITIFNQAVERAAEKCRRHIITLKTRRGKENAVQRFRESSLKTIEDYSWPEQCRTKLDEMCYSIINEFEQSEIK